jgi:hypothetical protein
VASSFWSLAAGLLSLGLRAARSQQPVASSLNTETIDIYLKVEIEINPFF